MYIRVIRRKRRMLFGKTNKEKLSEELEALENDILEANAMLRSIETSDDADWFKAPKLVLAKERSDKALKKIERIKNLL